MPRRLRRGDGIVPDPRPDAGRHHAALAALGLHESAGGQAHLRGARRRRRLRPALGRLSRVRGADDRGESARRAGEVDRHAHGRLPDRHARAQHDRPRPARARQGRQVPGDAPRLDRRHGRVPLAGRAGAHTQYDQLHDRRLQDPGALRDLPRRDHQHDAHRRLSRRRTAGYRVRRRAPGQPGRGGARHGSGGAAPAQLHSPDGLPVHVADRRAPTRTPTCRACSRRRSSSPTGRALRRAARNRRRPGSCAASASRPSSRTPAPATRPQDEVEIELDAGGTVTAFMVAKSQGQGHETTFGQIVANALQIPLEQGEDRAVRARHEAAGATTPAARAARSAPAASATSRRRS